MQKRRAVVVTKSTKCLVENLQQIFEHTAALAALWVTLPRALGAFMVMNVAIGLVNRDTTIDKGFFTDSYDNLLQLPTIQPYSTRRRANIHFDAVALHLAHEGAVDRRCYKGHTRDPL